VTESVAVSSDLELLAARRAVGLRAALLLGALTVVEYVLAISLARPLLVLLPFAVAKGWVILDAFMHVRALSGRRAH